MSQELLNNGLNNLVHNDVSYFENPIKLPYLNYKNLKNKDESWVKFTELAQEGDFLFTFDSRSLISKIISKIDRGPWSHVAICIGNNKIVEATTNGVIESDISVYESDKYHVGLYRPETSSEENKLLAITEAKLKIGAKYNYKGAIMAGIQKRLGIMNRVPTPNDLAVFPKLKLVKFI